MSSYQALFGQTPPSYIHYQPKDSPNHSVDTLLQERELHVKLLKGHLLKAQQRMKFQVGKHRSERQFKVGDWVFLKLQPYKQHSQGFP